MIKKLSAKRFKSVKAFECELDGINVLIGANNSGKSSILQAVHFAVAMVQSHNLVEGKSEGEKTKSGRVRKSKAKSGSISRSMSQQQILYTPAQDVMYLSEGRSLAQTQAKGIEIEVLLSSGEAGEVSITRGKNRNVSLKMSGDALPLLGDSTKPFSVYVPGLAGIAKNESYMAKGNLTRAVARGDANLVLRNVLSLLFQQPDKWFEFAIALGEVFPGSQLSVKFAAETDEFIDVSVLKDGFALPLECAGTGFLQTLQILSYIYLFGPAVTLLDEPDSHLHPNNQRALAQLLLKLVEQQTTQVIIATHSRHILDALRDDAKLIWMRDGQMQPFKEHLSLLLDLGALDKAEGLLAKQVKYVFLTEDADTTWFKNLLFFLPAEEYQVWSYKGCTNEATAETLAIFIKDCSPLTKIIVHRDSDYLPEVDQQRIVAHYENLGMSTYFPAGVDIESVHCDVEHLKAINPSHEDAVEQAFQEALVECSSDFRKKARTGREQVDVLRRRWDVQTMGKEERDNWLATVDLGQPRWLHGKTLVPVLRRRFQNLTKSNLELCKPSEKLDVSRLKQLLGLD